MQLQVLSRKGVLLRALDLHTKNRSLDIFTTKDKNYIIIKTQNDHDLVSIFRLIADRHHIIIVNTLR